MKVRKIFAAAFLLLLTGTASAQQMPPIPIDKEVKIGKLDNGLTYYIRHNAYPENVASFYIAQKVGSINEDDDQRGLAHLLEHLAFNGTDHFKDNDLQEYLQSIGVEYGRNLNAYTAVEQTVYYFTDVPTKRITAVDSCMMILKDWSNGITLTQKAIDDERDIVHNEYRMRMNGQQRMLERSLPKLYQDNKYGYRMPIGLMSIIDKCNPETLRAYYRKWYRPDNQAIIVVGDIDVNHIEEQIKKLFSGIKVPADAAKVIPVPVEDNTTPIYVIDKDKEQQVDLIQIMMKHETTPDSLKSNMAYLVGEYIKNVISNMLNSRYAEKVQESDCPLLQAGGSDGTFMLSSTKDAFSLSGAAKPGKIKEAYAALLREAKRAHDFGFTATEYQRAKDEFLSRMEKAYTNRNKMKNEQFTSQYVDHFIANEPIPSIEDEYQLYQMIVPNIPIDVVNSVAKQLIAETDTNFVSLVMLKETEGATYPTEQELTDIVKSVRNEKLEAYVDNVKQEPLMASLPKKGKIKKTTENKQLGYKELTLSNGATVILKKTDFKDNEILFAAHANVGYSALGKEDDNNVQMLSTLWGVSGLGNFSSTELEKALAGKQVSVGLSISPFGHGLSGNSTPKDIETMLQLVYLNMTALTKDEKAAENIRSQYITILSNVDKNPNLVYQDSLQSTIYMGNKMARIPTIEGVKAVNYDRIVELAHLYYGNAKDFTFYFVGNIDETTLLPLIEQYVASLPNKGFKLKNKEIPYAKGEVKNNFTKSMENPQSQATELWSAKVPFTLRNSVLTDISARVLEMTYNRNIRETLSAAYHAGAQGSLNTDYDGKVVINLLGEAQLNPDKVDVAIPYFFSGLKETVKEPNKEDLQKVKEILLKQADVDAKTNSYWTSVLRTYKEHGFDSHTEYKKTIQSVDGKAISDFLQNTILSTGNHIEVIMKAVKETDQ